MYAAVVNSVITSDLQQPKWVYSFRVVQFLPNQGSIFELTAFWEEKEDIEASEVL